MFLNGTDFFFDSKKLVQSNVKYHYLSQTVFQMFISLE